jgi:zinc/manganese transport system permease protein
MMMISTLVAALSGLIGLVVSFHVSVASGPSIILIASLFYFVSILFGRGGLVRQLLPRSRFAS